MANEELDLLSQQDRERHKAQAAAFWTVSLGLTLILLVAYPPTVALGAAVGWSVAGVFLVATLAYIRHLKTEGATHGESELLGAGVLAAAALGVDQWLAGGLHAPLYVMFTIHLIGSAAVLPAKPRRIHLAVVELAVLAPLVYDRMSWHEVVFVLVFAMLLVVEAAMIADFGERLRGQRRELHEAERLASSLALTDPLTGLGNRRAFGEALQTAAASLAERPVTVVYLDLDGFKAYNDRLGHEAGDLLLTRLGTGLTQSVRDHGRAFRVGGDEFCVLLTAVVAANGPEIAAIAGSLSDGDLSPSYGVVSMPADASDPDAAMRLADERMYAQKRARRQPPLDVATAVRDDAISR
jgi:diguanylate cyclase (GGDEF)-like protein